MFGHLQATRTTPARLIQLHHDEILIEALAHIGQEEVHHGGIGSKQDQAEQFTGVRSHGREHLDELPHELRGSRWAHTRRSPAGRGRETRPKHPSSWAMISTGRWSSAGLLATAASSGSRSFFKTLLLFWICLWVPGTRQEFALTVSLQQPVDCALMHRMPDALLIGALDFSGAGNLSLDGSCKERREQLPLLVPREQLMVVVLLCRPSPPLRSQVDFRSRSAHAPSLWRLRTLWQSLRLSEARPAPCR